MKQLNTKHLIELANEIGWECDVKKEGKEYIVTFSMYTPKGQDVELEFINKYLHCIWIDVRDYWENYNPDEEAIMWYGRNNGEPSSLRELLDDMEYVDDKLEKLYKKLWLD